MSDEDAEQGAAQLCGDVRSEAFDAQLPLRREHEAHGRD